MEQKHPPDPVIEDDGSRSFSPPGHAVCGLSEPIIPLLKFHRNLTKVNKANAGYILLFSFNRQTAFEKPHIRVVEATVRTVDSTDVTFKPSPTLSVSKHT